MDARAVMVDEFEKLLQAEFAENVAITTGAQSVTVRAVFERTYLTVDPDTQATVQSDSPRVIVARGLIPFAIQKRISTVVARGTEYLVRQPENDDEGALLLYLERA